MTRHKHYDALHTLIASPPEEFAKSFETYSGTFAAVADTKPSRPSNLLDLYMTDPRELLRDTQLRPDHYSPRQKEIAQELIDKKEGATDEEKNALLLSFMEVSRPKKVKKPPPKPEEDETVLEDGSKPQETEELVFEKQHPDDKTLV
jgi:hypothetical protein